MVGLLEGETSDVIKKVMIILLAILILFILIQMGMEPAGSVLWIIIFVLPFVFLYWLIRLVKSVEKKE